MNYGAIAANYLGLVEAHRQQDMAGVGGCKSVVAQ